MGTFRLDRVLEFLTSIELVVGLLWAGLAIFTVTLIVLMRTHWGQSRPLRKCMILSLWAHLLLIGYTTTVEFVFANPLPEEPVIRISFVEGSSDQAAGTGDPVSEEKPWERFLDDAVPQPDSIDPERKQPNRLPEPERQTQAEPANLTGEPALDHLALKEPEQPEPEPARVSGSTGRTSPGKSSAEQIDPPAPQRRKAPRPTLPDHPAPRRHTVPPENRSPPARTPSPGAPEALREPLVPLPRLATEPTTPEPANSLAGLIDRMSRAGRSDPGRSDTREADRVNSEEDTAYEAGQGSAGTPSRPVRPPVNASVGRESRAETGPAVPAGQRSVIGNYQPPRQHSGAAERELPDIYRLRVAPDRWRLAERQGATPETEAAVKAALKWLAANQKLDGRWDAGEHGAGREQTVAGRNRQGAGIQADTGMTGLALLAFLASGHTHQEGHYRENVRRGLEYLLRIQAGDGNLEGRASPYAKMYCHAMATFAISEAYGMTGDRRLRQPVLRAVNYTIAAQDPSAGGWRYKPGDPGDTSQAGWQLMALKSAELAGIPIPVKTRNGLIRFLRSVASGKHWGLASYRPKEKVSRAMTAEALVCWQFLGMPREHPAGDEAGDYLLGELPGQGEKNLYYWYYATLGMYQLQGTHWQRWNEALRTTLVESQRKTGPLAGTWDPDTVWGGYGGRVYSTALGALSLEVYYRFLPLYVEAAPTGGHTE